MSIFGTKVSYISEENLRNYMSNQDDKLKDLSKKFSLRVISAADLFFQNHIMESVFAYNEYLGDSPEAFAPLINHYSIRKCSSYLLEPIIIPNKNIEDLKPYSYEILLERCSDVIHLFDHLPEKLEKSNYSKFILENLNIFHKSFNDFVFEELFAHDLCENNFRFNILENNYLVECFFIYKNNFDFRFKSDFENKSSNLVLNEWFGLMVKLGIVDYLQQNLIVSNVDENFASLKQNDTHLSKLITLIYEGTKESKMYKNPAENLRTCIRNYNKNNSNYSYAKVDDMVKAIGISKKKD